VPSLPSPTPPSVAMRFIGGCRELMPKTLHHLEAVVRRRITLHSDRYHHWPTTLHSHIADEGRWSDLVAIRRCVPVRQPRRAVVSDIERVLGVRDSRQWSTCVIYFTNNGGQHWMSERLPKERGSTLRVILDISCSARFRYVALANPSTSLSGPQVVISYDLGRG
jgi:hypothetical protein